MRVVLKDYQRKAVEDILKELSRTKADWRQHQEQSAFALSAPTSSGKTVIAAAAIEATLHGSDEFNVEADPSALFLWVSKDPALNEQTIARFKQHADRIAYGDLVLLDKGFNRDSLQTGKVYFINPQKLAVTAGFVKRTDGRTHTFWDILANTINDPAKTLYMVLDEAHEGMKPQASGEQTIVQKIINGNGDNPPMPVVWGISATLDRFTKAMANTPNRNKRPNVQIDPKHVQASGLIKSAIELDIPGEDGYFMTTLLRDATQGFVEVSKLWRDYTRDQGIDEDVVPLMVVQIPNKAAGESQTDKGRQEERDLVLLILETIRKHWPDMPADGIAHVLGEDHGAITVGGYTIPRIEPQLVQQTTRVRILIAKDAISTGWDCPRAEVLVSLRPGKDPTYVTQLVGRMVRTPLAQSTSVDRLNSASAYLPAFDRATTKRLVDELLGDAPTSDKGSSTSMVGKVLLRPVTLVRNPDVGEDVVGLIASLPSFPRPSATARPIKRLLKAAQAFAQDGLVPDANKLAHETLFAVLDSVAAAHPDDLDEQARQVLTAEVHKIRIDMEAKEAANTSEEREADAGTVADALRQMQRLLTKSVLNGYLARNVQAAVTAAEADGGSVFDVDVLAEQARVAALGYLKVPDGEPSIATRVESAADVLTRQWLTLHDVAIAGLSDTRRSVYTDVRGMAKEPEQTPTKIGEDDRVDSVDRDLKPLPTAKLHVLATEDGDFPLDLNRWERAAVHHELEHSSVAGWYRNPSTSGQSSLRVAFKDSSGWKTVQPDFVFVHERTPGKLTASIIDPHGNHLGDASPKLKALADYAAHHGQHFERIIAAGVETAGNDLLGLDLLDPDVRRAVYESPSDKDSLATLYKQHGKKYLQVPKDV